jgi:CBS domain-containing protein
MTETVQAHMTPTPWTVHADETAEQAARIMRLHGLRHLPVLEDGSLVGVLDHDELRVILAFGTPGKPVCVRDAMTRDPLVVQVDAPLGGVARAMAERHHDSAVVMAHGKVAGVLCVFDALRALARRA